MAIVIDNINLEPEIEQWRNAYCGKDVRQANIDAFEKIQDSVNGAIQGVTQVANNQQTVIDNAQASVDQSNQAVQTIHAEAKATLQAAQEAQQSAAQDAQEAAGSASAAANSATQAENQADRAEQYANLIMPKFILQDNKLYINTDSTISFLLDGNELYFKAN